MTATLRIGAPARHRSADTLALRDEAALGLAVSALLLVVSALSFAGAGAGAVARPLFMLGALAISAIAKRRSPWLYLNATLWFWLTTAFVRRMIEWRSGFTQADIVLVTPHLAAMLIVPDILATRGLLRRRGTGYALLLTGCLLYGLFVSFVRGDLVSGLFSATDWLVPLLYLYFFICHADRIDEAEPHFSAFLGANLLLVVPYSLCQFFLMPAWDAAWISNSGIGSLGRPLPMDARIFGPTNSPLPLAIWGGTCIVLLAHFRSRLLLILTPFLFVTVALTMVRAVYGSMTLALLTGALLGRGGFGRLASIIVLAGLTGYVGAAVLDPQVVDKFSKRLESIQRLDTDGSAGMRERLYAETPQLIDENPFGLGIGAQGRGQAAQGGENPMGTANVDSGPLSVFLALGWLAGPLYLLATLLLLLRALRIGRSGCSQLGSTMAAAAICPLATFPFINVLGFDAVVLWTCLGYALALDIRAAARRP